MNRIKDCIKWQSIQFLFKLSHDFISLFGECFRDLHWLSFFVWLLNYLYFAILAIFYVKLKHLCSKDSYQSFVKQLWKQQLFVVCKYIKKRPLFWGSERNFLQYYTLSVSRFIMHTMHDLQFYWALRNLYRLLFRIRSRCSKMHQKLWRRRERCKWGLWRWEYLKRGWVLKLMLSRGRIRMPFVSI